MMQAWIWGESGTEEPLWIWNLLSRTANSKRFHSTCKIVYFSTDQNSKVPCSGESHVRSLDFVLQCTRQCAPAGCNSGSSVFTRTKVEQHCTLRRGNGQGGQCTHRETPHSDSRPADMRGKREAVQTWPVFCFVFERKTLLTGKFCLYFKKWSLIVKCKRNACSRGSRIKIFNDLFTLLSLDRKVEPLLLKSRMFQALSILPWTQSVGVTLRVKQHLRTFRTGSVLGLDIHYGPDNLCLMVSLPPSRDIT